MIYIFCGFDEETILCTHSFGLYAVTSLWDVSRISSLEVLHAMHQNFFHFQFHFFNRNWVGDVRWLGHWEDCESWEVMAQLNSLRIKRAWHNLQLPERGWKAIPSTWTMRCAITTWRSLARNFSSKSFLLAFFRNKFSFSFFLSRRKWQQRNEREGFTSRTDDDIRSLRSKHVVRQGKNGRHKDARMKQHFKVLEL